MFEQTEVYIRNAMNGMALTMIPEKNSKKEASLRVFYLRDGNKNQKFYVNRLEQDKYMVRNIGTGKVLDLFQEKVQVYTEVIGYDSHCKNNQLWRIQEGKDGFMYITSAKSGMVLEIQGGINEQSMRVVQNIRYGNLNQLWKFEKA